MHLIKTFYTLSFLCAVFVSTGFTEEVSKFFVKRRPEDLNGTTLTMPQKVVAMSEYIKVSNSFDSIMGETLPVSLFFVIDNSTSMEGSFGTDQNGTRFTVLSSLLDTIFAKSPKTEIGMVVFRKTAYFWDQDDQNKFGVKIYSPVPTKFVPTDCVSYHSAYCNLLTLNKSYNTMTGYQILKEILKTNTTSQGTTLAYIPGNTQIINDTYGTNISLAFDCAKEALSKSIYPKAKQFNIFISDGEANIPDNDAALKFFYVKGEATPTTFTIFFTNNNEALANLNTMTTNIQTNNFSITNPKSDIWPLKTSEDSLKALISKNILPNIIISQITFVPETLAVSVSGGQMSSSQFDGNGFLFKKLFPLTGQSTPFDQSITYGIIKKDSLNPNGVWVKDTTHKINFTVDLQSGSPLPDSVILKSWDRKIEFFYNGSQITQANELMDKIEVRFTMSKVDTIYGYTNVKLVLSNTVGFIDKETISLSQQGNVHNASFSRTCLGGISGDNVLNHQTVDTLIATFSNPDLPLDVLTERLPYRSKAQMSLTKAELFDNTGDGFVDSAFVQLQGSAIEKNLDLIVNNLHFPPQRNLEIVSKQAVGNGIAFVVKEHASQFKTYITDEDSVTTDSAALSDGTGSLIYSKVTATDCIAPVVVKATLIDSVKAGSTDILTVVHSEPITKPASQKPYRYITKNNIDTKNFKLSLSSSNQETAVYRLSGNIAPTILLNNDSLFIDAQQTPGITDSKLNQQHADMNRRVPIEITTIQDGISIASARFMDNNADGHLDSIHIALNGESIKENSAALLNELKLPAQRILAINNRTVTDNSIDLSVSENSSELKTWTDKLDDIGFDNTVNVENNQQILQSKVTPADGMAPVLIKDSIHIRLHISYKVSDEGISITSKSRNLNQSALFSENIKSIGNKKPLLYKSVKDNSSYDIVVTDAQVKDNIMTSGAEESDKPTPNDSVWICDAAKVSDVVDNLQSNGNNIHRNLIVTCDTTCDTTYDPYSLHLKSTFLYKRDDGASNLTNINVNNIVESDKAREILDRSPVGKTIDGGYYHLMIISLSRDTGNDGKTIPIPSTDHIMATISVFDALGNAVIYNRPMFSYKADNGDRIKQLIYFWNGTNKLNKTVANGVYIALCRITGTRGDKEFMTKTLLTSVGVR